MAITVDQAFVKQYEKEVHHLYQQTQPKLLGTARVRNNIIGDSVQFPVMGPGVATTKAVNAFLTNSEPVISKVTASVTPYFYSVLEGKIENVQTNVDLRQEYAKIAIAAINREVDRTIITAAVAGSNVITTSAGGWTYAKHLEAITKLNAADVNEEDRFIVVSAAQLSEMLNETKVISGDYNSLMPAMSGKIGQFMGFKVIMTNLLPKASTVRTCLYLNKQAVGVGVSLNPSTEINYESDKFAYRITSSVMLGAVLVDGTGVVEVPCTEAA